MPRIQPTMEMPVCLYHTDTKRRAEAFVATIIQSSGAASSFAAE